MNRIAAVAAAVFMLVGFFGQTPADAAPLTAGGGWVAFSFDDIGWGTIFSFSGPATLLVTDAFQSGDRFAIYDFGVLLGNTTLPGSLGDIIGSDYNAAFADPRWSSGTFVLGAGPHEISGTTLMNPFGGGGAAIQLALDADTRSVPEPTTLTLLGVGLLGLAGVIKRRANQD